MRKAYHNVKVQDELKEFLEMAYFPEKTVYRLSFKRVYMSI